MKRLHHLGIDKCEVGQLAASAQVRPPEQIKGKGIRYEGEYTDSDRQVRQVRY